MKSEEDWLDDKEFLAIPRIYRNLNELELEEILKSTESFLNASDEYTVKVEKYLSDSSVVPYPNAPSSLTISLWNKHLRTIVPQIQAEILLRSMKNTQSVQALFDDWSKRGLFCGADTLALERMALTWLKEEK